MASTQEEGRLKESRDAKIILSLVILLYVIFCHPNSRICLHGTRSRVVVSVVYLPKVFINFYYSGGIITWKNPNIKSTMDKT